MKPKLILVPALLIITITLSIAVYLYIKSEPEPNSYDECTKQNGSTILAIYPGKCISKSKKEFTQQIPKTEDKTLEFKTITKSDSKSAKTDFQENDFKIIKNEAEWKNLYINIDEQLENEEIDFEKEMIIAVFQGEKNTAGYSIEITKITEFEKKIEISITKKVPALQCFTLPVTTSPFHIVKIEKTEKEIIFLPTEKEIECFG